MKLFLYFAVAVILITLPDETFAKKYDVNSSESFEAAQQEASSGDSIVWQEGVYSNIVLNIYKSELIIVAATPGKTIFTGASRLKMTGDHNLFSGFQFLKGNIASDDVIVVEGSHNQLTQLNIKDYYCEKYLIIEAGSVRNTVAYCNFENRTFIGDKNILSILVSPYEPGYHTIRYCSFKNFSGSSPGGDAGVEPIRIGLSTQAEYISRSVVEYCYFTQCNGDGEIISHKSKQNVYRYNTFEGNPYGELVLRHGDAGMVYGNFFLDGYGGIRIKEGQDHVVFNNYFEGLTERALTIMNHGADPLDNILIAYNTFINNEEIKLGGDGSYAPSNVTFANNIFADPVNTLFDNPTGTEQWIGNISSGDLGMTNKEGIREVWPGLVLNSEGFYELKANSTAIDSAQGGYPVVPDYNGLDIDHEILLDLMKEQRPDNILLRDIGCEEYSSQTTVKPHATEAITGPSYIHEHKYVMLEVKGNGEGTVSLDPVSGVYEQGAEVTLTANPGIYEVFKFWEGDLKGDHNPVTLLMDGDKTITANFESLRPVVSGLDITVNNEDGFTVAKTSKVGYVYIVQFGNNPQSKRELDSLVNINLGVSFEATQANASVAIYTEGLPGGVYEYYAVDSEGRISYAAENLLIIEETGVVTGVRKSLSSNSFSVTTTYGQIIVDPGTDARYSLRIYSTEGRLLYNATNISGKKYLDKKQYSGSVIVQKVAASGIESVRYIVP